MIVRRCLTPTAVFIVLTLLDGFGGCTAERWSRQTSNSEWIPLANPGSAQLSLSKAESGLLSSSTHLPNPIQTLALPPALQHQYQEQLLQLQKTQESIQKLLLLQQQLKAQQQLLQTQTFLPGDYSSAEAEKQALPQSSLGNLQTAPELVPNTLVPPHPSSGALPPVHPSQNFLSQRPGQTYQNQELSNLPVQGQVVLQQNVEDTQEGQHAYVAKTNEGKRWKEQSSPGLPQSSLIGNDEEEVQLVYVPAETLAQRGQLKRNRGRKQYPIRQQHQQRDHGNIDQTSLSPDQETFARQVLQQIQKEHEEKAQFLKDERVKEFVRLNEEQKALERKTRLQQEALQREQELLRQKEADKKRKELERLEEMARQRELDRIRDAREKQRQEELERRRLSELRVKEDRRREEEARQREERQKLELEQQRILESQQEDQLRTNSPNFQNAQSQALIRDQGRRQHLTDPARIKKLRGRQRPRVNQYQEQSNYREVTTTPSPNQPPLSVYMGSPTSKPVDNVKVTDVLRLLRNAKTIAVLDNVGPNSPQVFVGPSNLDPPYGYVKFDLPYLSSIDHNRVERKVDKLPFFVAPLSFDPPPGYSKIPFPAPHIGSVVVNNLSEASTEPNTQTDEQNPNPTPLIQPNSYSDVDHSGSIATTASYDSSTDQNFSPESSSLKYDPTYSPPSSSKFRFRQYYDNKPTSVGSTSYYGEQSTTKTKPKHYHEQETKFTTQPPKIETTASYRQEVSYSNTPSFQDRSVSPHDTSAKEQDLAAQLALINQELAQQREPQKYNTAEQYHSQSNLGESYDDANDVRGPVGPTQYNLPAELPPISPHLPGLVNSLLDKQERNLPVAPTPPPTTTTTTTPTTTTTRINSTTYRPRGRGRNVPTRPRTTQAPANRTERTRRPTHNRAKSRFTTTTEEYRESSYEPTKAKTPETTQKYNAVEQRRPASRTQKHRNRDRANQSAVQSQGANYENYPQSDASPDAYSPPSGPASGPENYPTTPMQTENYPSSLREVQHSTPIVSDDYARSQNYPQNRPQEARYQHQDVMYDQNGDYQQAGLEKTPVNGFNYQVANENSPDQTISQRPKEYHYQEDYNLATTVESRRVTPGEEHRYSPIYEVNVAQTQPDYNVGGQNSFRNDDGKIESAAIETDPNASPIFVPLQQSKQQDYDMQIPSTEPSLIEIATTSTTTPAPVIIRQRVRARLGGGRTHHDSAIQTRPRNSQDEYVRFSAVNNDSGRGAGQRHRTRTRARPQSHGSQVQTEGNEYIKIHANQQQRLVATTVPPTTTSTTARTVEEDVDYGFIRPPNFQPAHPPHPVHPVDNRYQAPITYRPALSEIQHIFSNDETAVESSPAHILKNRPKYQTSSRRPTTKLFTTTTTSTSTETVPVATTMPDDAVYTTKSKTRLDDPKSTRTRGRVRRPGKKRTTTTTESGLEANNELPLDENYPRITPQQLPVTASGQQPLYDDNFDVAPQFVPNQNRPAQFYEENSENYPPQEFVLNFGNLPEQLSQREEYDQTQLASIPKKYSHSSRVNSDASAHSTGDIYGAESQWSTKLSKTSFQPSFAENRVPGESKRGRGGTGNDQENENTPEIITAGPEESSVTMVVSSDYQKHANDADNTGTVIDGFGWKTTAQDHREELNATTAVTNSSTTVLQDQTRNDKETLPGSRDWTSSKNFTEQIGNGTRVAKPDSLLGRKTRRRKVRVRVRPLVDDFVTAESQHYNSAVNSLVQDQYKYNPIHDSRFTTAQPIATTVTASTAMAAESTKKSLLQDFLEEMLKNDEVSIPTRVTPITTELPDRTILTPMTTPMTTPYVFPNNGEVTTLKENYTPIDTTLIPKINEERVTTINENSNGSKDESQEATTLSQEKTEVRKEVQPEENKNSQEDKQNNLENVVFKQRYNLPHYPDRSGKNKDEGSITKLIDFPKEETRKLSAIGKEKEHIMRLKKQENVEENEAHPKNHRVKWSEVKYPSFDKSQTASNSYSTTTIPGIVTRDESNGNVKTLTDYVKAIFDSMKNAEEGEKEEAKVIAAKSETDNYNLNDTASAHAKENEKIDRKASTTGSSQDISTTQRVEVEENATKAEETQEATTKENATTLESTTPIPDTTTNTVLSEETLVTEPSTTTTKTIRQTNNVLRTNSTMLGKVLRTSTTTKVSHMTEICYRGRCVMTRPKMEDIMKR